MSIIAVYISALGALLVIINMLWASIYGRLECVLAMLKISLIVGVNIVVSRSGCPKDALVGF